MASSVEEFNDNLLEEYFKELDASGKRSEIFESNMLQHLFSEKDYDRILTLLIRGFDFTISVRFLILQSGNLALYQFLYQKDGFINESFLIPAILSGNEETVRWVWNLVSSMPHDIYVHAIKSCNQRIFNLIFELIQEEPELGDYEFDELFSVAVKVENIEFLKYLQGKAPGQMRRVDLEPFDRIIRSSLPLTIFFHSINRFRIYTIAVHAIQDSRLDILEWCLSNGLKLEPILIHHASYNKSWKSMEFLISRKCPYSFEDLELWHKHNN